MEVIMLRIYKDFTRFMNRDEFLDLARKFVLLLHGKKAKSLASLDELRYHIATTTDKPAASNRGCVSTACLTGTVSS